jgi:UDP-N-acetylmuramoyl-tripeptide--D-alanyl-D-alanine ligase
VITTIGQDHYRQFRSLEATAREKGSLVERLPTSGVAILNADDPHVLGLRCRTRARIFTYGASSQADLRVTDISSVWPSRLSLAVSYRDETAFLQTRLVGEHWATSVLAAIACGLACGVELRTCAKAIENVDAVFGRYSVHGKEGAPTYVLDTRKAPYWTLAKAFEVVDKARAPRKTIVLGTISDRPGGMKNAQYREVAVRALKICDRVVFVGPQAYSVEKMRTGVTSERLFAFPATREASRFLNQSSIADEFILVKGSIADHLERLMLSKLDHVICWRERCGKHRDCPVCKKYRVAFPAIELTAEPSPTQTPGSRPTLEPGSHPISANTNSQAQELR